MEEPIIMEKEIKTILVIDDEPAIRDLLKYNLEREGYQIIEASDGVEGINVALEQKPDIILLDIMLPKLDGLSVCKRIKNSMNIPIIMLTARSEEIETKPVEVASEEKKKESKIVVGDLELDLDRFEVKVRGEIIDLTLREFEVLKFLASQPEQVVTRETLLEKVWGYEYFGDIRTVDVTVRRIREKIEKDTSIPKILITKRGVGYYIATN